VLHSGQWPNYEFSKDGRYFKVDFSKVKLGDKSLAFEKVDPEKVKILSVNLKEHMVTLIAPDRQDPSVSRRYSVSADSQLATVNAIDK
jgi:hypothetical protein